MLKCKYHSFEKVAEKIKNIRLKPSKTKIYPYASETLVTKGYFMCKFETPHKIAVQKCYVVNKDKVANILGLETAKDLNIVKLQNVNKSLDDCKLCENIKL